MKHPDIKNQKVVDKVLARRGTLHAYNTFDLTRTALVVIDLMLGTIQEDERCLAFIPLINSLASNLRGAGGTVAWVTVESDVVQANYIAVFGQEIAEEFHQRAQDDDPRSKLHEDLIVDPIDVLATKKGFSAFFPGRANLHEQLEKKQVETVFICGAVTNICCESSARDAVELGYKVILVSDLNAGHKHGLHEATLTTFYRTFGDVRSYSEIMKMLDNQ